MSSFTVYQKDYGPYCKAAESLMDGLGWPYQQIEVSSTPTLFAEVVKHSGRRTVPQVFLGDDHIGGFEDLQRYVRSNGETLKRAHGGACARTCEKRELTDDYSQHAYHRS